MVKAKGKGKGKGKKKAVVEVDPNALTEVDKAFYELTITDLNRKLARLRSLTQELEDKNEELKTQNEKLDEDKSDIIVYLKRMLQEKTDEITELEERITALQETRQDETQKSEEKIEKMETEYKQMHEQLTSENKLLEGKLNSLEEFRTQRDDLMKKFEDQEQSMALQEKKHKRELYEIERKFIISKDQLKRDMEARLLQLSTEFQDATEIRIAATTHRVIRENIAVNNELDLLLESQRRLYNENLAIKKRDTTLKQQAELHEVEKKKALAKVKLQLKIIERLTEDHDMLEDELKKYTEYELEVYQIKKEMRERERRIKELEYHQKLLEQNLHNVRCDRTSIQTDFLYVKDENDRLSEILMEAVSFIKEALTVRSESDQSVKATKRENLLNSLFTLLSKAKDQKIRRPSAETVDAFDATYARGDLGFVPKPVELRTFVPTTRNMESQTGDSFEEYLQFGTISSPQMLYSESRSSEEIKVVEEEEESFVEEEIESVLFFDSSEVAEEETDQSKEFDIFAAEIEDDDLVKLAESAASGVKLSKSVTAHRKASAVQMKKASTVQLPRSSHARISRSSHVHISRSSQAHVARSSQAQVQKPLMAPDTRISRSALKSRTSVNKRSVVHIKEPSKVNLRKPSESGIYKD